ncbi:interferon-inducible GTPase 5-like [Mustela lutreola]|uniref:interferon-inducible GTPase 5-like n=1 Tax=Mustela lutreola TaxID=9666 RepID=UPI002797C9CC|nr:interferon-inducible GTPase 5-like [Mustela lutreola]XP_059006964.1 interferon-inducible GTPase 5-like [Mustela lutreola]XP_059006965.1 interferon-inducible GTPase 5-like [Mustela lutreola]
MASRVFPSSLSQSKILKLWGDSSTLKGVFEAGDMSSVATKLQATLYSLENARLDVGITGDMGSGKSTFVNAIRGLGDEDPKSAYTGVVEMTVGPTPYAHPKYPNVVIWDLPGIGAPTFQAEKYLQRVLPARYDFFIIISSESFAAHHAQLARELRQCGKRFYLIRSKVDVDIAASRSRRPSTFSEERVLSQIRDDCCRRLEVGGLQDPKVFLLSMFELGKYDFHLLEEMMVKELESHKQHAFLQALPNVSKPILEKKAASLRQHIWLVAAVASGINPSPVPGVRDVACDLHMLINSLQGYRCSFGLDKDSLVTLAGQTGQALHKILEAARGPETQVTEALVVERLGQASRDASAFTQELLNVPILGTLANCGISFATIYQMLRTSLDEAVKDAQRLLLQAFLDDSEHEFPDRSNP